MTANHTGQGSPGHDSPGTGHRAPGQRDKAIRLRSLHHGGPILALANAWDVASARLVEKAGATAIATTSAGVAWSLGVPDGDKLDRVRAVEVIAGIATAVDLPVTADIESGFASTTRDIGDTIDAVLTAGAVGINLEDALQGATEPLRPPTEQMERIAAARRTADSAGIPLFINARTDVYLRSVGDPAGRLAATTRRASAYLEAGADGIFVPGVADPGTIAALVEAIDAPVNVLAGPGFPSVHELQRLGVRRVSLGSSVAAAAYSLAWRAAEELLHDGSYTTLAAELDYAELNDLMSRAGPDNPAAPT